MAIQAPTVQSLDQIMAELHPGYEGQRSVISQQISNTDAAYAAQKQALDAQKTQGFNQINTQATGRGLTFSGIPLDEQANYLSTTYLPGVQAAAAKQNEDRLTLQGQLAALDTDIRNRAQSTRDQQVSALNAWNLQQQQLEAQAREAAANRAAQARMAAANRVEKELSPYDVGISYLTDAVKDGKKITPEIFKSARALYVGAGGEQQQFFKDFWQLVPLAPGKKNQSSTLWDAYYY